MLDSKRNLYFVELSDTGSKLKLMYNLIILVFNFLFIIPHLVIFSLHPNRVGIRSDVENVRNLILSLIFLKHYRNLFYYRIGNFKYLVKWILPEDNSIHLPVRMKLGKAALFVHSTSSYLNAKSIGDYFICYHNVTIGTKSLQLIGKPIIGDKVTICTGAVVVGAITIGDNVVIGANTVITKNVPSNTTVIGSPAKIVILEEERVNILL